MLRPPSLQNNYTEYSQFDPSFRQLPDKATDKQRAKHDAIVKRCRERGDWSELRVEGGPEPTAFEMRPLPGSVFRPIVDMSIAGRVGPAAFNALLVRAALMGVENIEEGGGTEVGFVPFDGLPGKIADSKVTDMLDADDKRHVVDLGQAVLARAKAIAPRS